MTRSWDLGVPRRIPRRGSPGSGAKTGEVLNERPLDERPMAGMMRLDALTGDWVSVADHRQNRTFLPPADECPLCPSGGGSMPSEIPAHEYDVVVFENRLPSFCHRFRR